MSLKLIGFFGFLITALGFTALTVLLAARRPSALLGRMFLLVNMVQAVWAWSLTLAFTPLAPPIGLVAFLESLRTLGWTAFLVVLIRGEHKAPSTPGKAAAASLSSLPRIAIIGASLIAIVASLLDIFGEAGLTSQTSFMLKTLASIVGLVCLEQAYRATPQDQRWSLKLLAIALAGLFAFDLAMYSEAVMFSRLNLQWWTARGYTNLLLVPLMAVTAVRNRNWKTPIAVSRNMVFHSTALLLAGLYLVLTSLAGYYVRYVGGNWGEVAQAVLIFAALVGMMLVAFSGAMRARLRVFLAKNFFNYRFDYRHEWLRLTDTLHSSRANRGEPALTSENLIRSLGRIVESPGGALWLRKDGHFAMMGGVGIEHFKLDFEAAEPVLEFMARRDWIIDMDEYRRDRAAYESIQLPTDLLVNKALWILVPLSNAGQLEGVIGLTHPLTPTTLNWEVRDILKVAASQLASLVSLQNAVESLVQARQFDSFNKMSAFVVHDLKNLVSQLSLLVRNASTHRHDPEFQQDMIETVENVLERMQGLLMQLRLGTKPIEKPQAVPVEEVVLKAIASKKALKPQPVVHIDPVVARSRVLAHPDRLERVIGHLVQNACEAMSGRSGQVVVSATAAADRVGIQVSDTGIGMTPQFMKTMLFKPFNSTKSHGMGIGTFESREYLREIGGSLAVESQEQVGTTFRIELPTAPLHAVDS